MSVGIIVPGLPNYAPYLKSYTDLFDDLNIKYTFICWNRNYDRLDDHNNMIVFNKPSYESDNFIKKIYGYFLFSSFVKKQLRQNNYKFLTVHTIACAIFLKTILKQKKYILDIRDFSPLVPFFRSSLLFLIQNSIATMISSKAYKKWLPKNHRYILSHNVRKTDLDINKFDSCKIKSNKKIEVLTIGQIRDFSSNSKLIKYLGNSECFDLKFIGDGTELVNLKKYSKDINNIEFSGRYDKKDEPGLVIKSDIINILLPNSPEAMTQMTNRFYLGLMYKKPMIVNKDSIQSYYIEKFNLGLTVGSYENIHNELLRYFQNYNPKEFEKGCVEVLNIVKNDIYLFEKTIKTIFKNNNEKNGDKTTIK